MTPEHFQSSPAFQFVTSQGWGWKESDAPNIRIDKCPYCGATGEGHSPFRMEIHSGDDEQKNRDGLHMCHRCGKGGRLYDLKQHLGLIVAGVDSRKDWGGAERAVEPLPDVDACHEALLADEAAMDYLINGRGFSQAIIERMKLGFVAKRFFRETGEVRALVYPYLVNGNCVFVHYRTLPTMPLSENDVPKAFSSPKGWDAPLYNGEVLRSGLTELFVVEGEPDAIAALDHGVENIVAVPGANFKKADWIDTMDSIGLEKVYICYDKDKAGQKASQALAARIGIERCWKISLPEFTVVTEDGVTRSGKDLNEWFVQGGGTAEKFEKLKESAILFDVDGVASSKDAVQEFADELAGKETLEPTYKTGWLPLNKLVGFEDGDVIDIIAEEKVGKTTFAMNLIEHAVDTYGEDGIIICLEMMRARMARKWVAHKAQIADNIPKSIEEAKALADAFKKAIPEIQEMASNRAGDLYFCYPKYKNVDDIYTLIRDCIRRYGVKWVVIDNLQLLCDVTLGSRNRTQHLSSISKSTAQIAKDYGIKMIRILQPHRIGEGRMVTTSDVDGASQVAKDCDCMLTAHRNKVGTISAEDFRNAQYVEQDAAFEDKMLIGVGLSRYSSGGYVTLYYDGARSTVTEYDPVRIAVMQADASKDVGHQNQMDKLGISAHIAAQAATIPAGVGGEVTV